MATINHARPLLAVAAACLIAIAAIALAFPGGSTEAAPAGGQRETSLQVARCTEVDVGDTFTVDIRAVNVTDLLAWEVYFAYDRDIIELEQRDVLVFLNSLPGSNVADFSDPLPNDVGLYRMGASDLGSKDALETGSGTLVRLTITAKKKGVSPAAIHPLDFDGDGVGDIGPTITAFQTGRAVHLGDTNGDYIFDGTTVSGQIAVGQPCVTPVPEPVIEDILERQPSIADPELLPPPEEGHQPDLVSGGASGGGSGTDGGSGGPNAGGGQAAGDDGTSATGNGRTSDSGSNGGMPIWLIGLLLLVVTAAGLGAALSFSILRSNRGL